VTPVVLAPKKGAVDAVEKGKESDIKKWEAELRKSLAQKSDARPTLTKHEKALVDSQLAKEEVTRNRLRLLQQRLHDGLSMIQSLLISRNIANFGYLPRFSSLLIGGVVRFGTPLIGSDGVFTYIVRVWSVNSVIFDPTISRTCLWPPPTAWEHCVNG